MAINSPLTSSRARSHAADPIALAGTEPTRQKYYRFAEEFGSLIAFKSLLNNPLQRNK
jgi:hypothetical protein